MKTIILSLLLLISYSVTIAQDWCHQGSKWQYSWGYFNTFGIDQYSYTKDTMLNNHPCHQLSLMRYSDSNTGNNQYHLDSAIQAPLYTYSQQDTVYFYYDTFSEWLPTYFMNVQVGDTLIIPNSGFYGLATDTIVHVVVDSTGITVVDTNHLSFYTFHVIDTCPFGMLNLLGKGTVIERLGMWDNDIVPYWHCTTDDTYYSFCSYQDDSFAVYPSGGCPALPSGINEVKPISLHIQPNPAQDEISINIDADMIGVSMSIADIDGRSLVKTQLNNTDNNISVADLANGIYLLTISDKGQQSFSRKLAIAR